MNKQNRQGNSIRQLIDARLSGIHENPNFEMEVLQQVRGDIKVKRKLSVGLIIAITIVLVIAVAFGSVMLKEYYKKAFDVQNDAGYYQQWPLKEKIDLVDRMVAGNFDVNMKLVAKLHDNNLSDDEKNDLADAIVIAYYGEGRDGVLSTVDIMEKDMGKMADWSLEDKAWVSEQELQGGNKNIEEIHKLPQEGDITEDQAIDLACQILIAQYGLLGKEVESYHITVDFMQLTDDSSNYSKNEDVYQIAFYTPFSDVHPYFVLLSADGTFLHSSRPFGMDQDINDVIGNAKERFSTPEEKAEFSQKWAAIIREAVSNDEDVWGYYQHLSTIDYISPDERFITEKNAQAKAETSVYSVLGWEQQLLERYDPFISLRRIATGDRSMEQAIWYFKYVVDAENIELYWNHQIPWGVNVTINARTGETLTLEEASYDDRYSQFNE